MSETEASSSNGNEPVDRAQPVPFPLQEPAPSTPAPEHLKRGRTTQRRYFLWMRLSRLALSAFAFMCIIILLWLIPWSPTGIDTSDYTPQLAFTVYLLAGAVVIGLAVLSFQELARRDRQTLSAWATVYDEVTGLHNRAYLYDRLSLECDRALQSKDPFSIVVLQFRAGGADAMARAKQPPLSNATLQKIAQAINSVTHPTDMVGLLSGSELAIVAVRVDREKRRLLQRRLEHASETSLADELGNATSVEVRSGASTYGVDGDEPGALVQAARTSAALSVRQRIKAA